MIHQNLPRDPKEVMQVFLYAGLKPQSFSATIFLELLLSCPRQEVESALGGNPSLCFHRSEESVHSQRWQKAEQEGRVVRGEASLLILAK